MPHSNNGGESTVNPLIGSSRLAVTITLMFGCSLFYAMRVDMSVAIICMTNHTALRQLKTSSIGDERTTNNNNTDVNNKCQSSDVVIITGDNNKPVDHDGPFVWDSLAQSQILGAFFFGYLILQIPAGWLSDSLGGRWVIFVSMASLAAATALLPLVAINSWFVVAMFRVLQGFASGAYLPAITAIISQWAPPLERASLNSLAGSGMAIGSVLTFPVSGFLCRFLGWQFIFYFWGGLTLIWLIVWFHFGYNTPGQHPRITPAERIYITTSANNGNETNKVVISLNSVPWLDILKSPPVWACLVANFAGDWGSYTFMSQTPRFLKTVHNFDIGSNSLISAIPYLGSATVTVVSGRLADHLQQKKMLTTLQVRRLFALIGFMVPSVLLLLLGVLSCEHSLLAVIVLIAIISTSGMQYACWPVSLFDFAPNFAGILFGFLNTFACASGVLTNSLAGTVMSPHPTLSEWRLLFVTTAGVMAFGCFAYCALIRTQVQPWAIFTKKIQLEKVDTLEKTLLDVQEDNV